jgi:hypothetical protein
MNRGRIAEGGAEITPKAILGSLAWWYRADLGVTIGAGVSAWADQSGNGVNLTQATGGLQPAFLASAVNGKPAIQGDGVDDLLAATWARVAPSSQPFYIWLVCQQPDWTAALRTFISDFVATGFFYNQNNVTPQLTSFNAINSSNNGAATLGSYFRHEMQFGNSVADYVKIGATNVTGVNTGDNAGGGTLSMFCRSSGIRHSNVAIAEAFCKLGTPSAGDRASLDSYCAGRYGAGLT